MWYDLKGQIGRAASSSGTVTLSPGQIIISIRAHATTAGSITLPDGNIIPLPAAASWFVFEPKHLLTIATKTQSTILFTGTDSYIVEWIDPPGGAG